MLKFLKKINNNFLNSLNGIKEALKEHSFISEIYFGFFLFIYLFNFNISLNYKLVIIFAYIILLVTEIINTSIEKICNKITKKKDNEIRIIKDLASAAVFIVLLFLITILSITIYQLF